jgi:hypothetical protein
MAHNVMFAEDDVIVRFNPRSNAWESNIVWRPRLWRTGLMWTALVIFVCIALKIALISASYSSKPKLDQQSEAFAEKAVDSIDADWNEEKLLNLSSEEFASTRSPVFDKQFSVLQKIGPGARDNDCIGSSHVDPIPFTSRVTASYTCPIRLKSTPAVAVVFLSREADTWKISGFHVSTLSP